MSGVAAVVLAAGLLGSTTDTSAHFENRPSQRCANIDFSKKKHAFAIRSRSVSCKRAQRIVRRFHNRNVIPNWRFLYAYRSDGDRDSRRAHVDLGVDDRNSDKRVTWAYHPPDNL